MQKKQDKPLRWALTEQNVKAVRGNFDSPQWQQDAIVLIFQSLWQHDTVLLADTVSSLHSSEDRVWFTLHEYITLLHV